MILLDPPRWEESLFLGKFNEFFGSKIWDKSSKPIFWKATVVFLIEYQDFTLLYFDIWVKILKKYFLELHSSRDRKLQLEKETRKSWKKVKCNTFL